VLVGADAAGRLDRAERDLRVRLELQAGGVVLARAAGGPVAGERLHGRPAGVEDRDVDGDRPVERLLGDRLRAAGGERRAADGERCDGGENGDSHTLEVARDRPGCRAFDGFQNMRHLPRFPASVWRMGSDRDDDRRLAARAGAGDERAFGELVDRHREPLLRYVGRRF
jgi:hypothetical protein